MPISVVMFCDHLYGSSKQRFSWRMKGKAVSIAMHSNVYNFASASELPRDLIWIRSKSRKSYFQVSVSV